MHINKRYHLKNGKSGQTTILEFDLGAQELALLQYEGIEQEYPYIATIKPDHGAERLMAVIELFTLNCVLYHVEYVTIP